MREHLTFDLGLSLAGVESAGRCSLRSARPWRRREARVQGAAEGAPSERPRRLCPGKRLSSLPAARPRPSYVRYIRCMRSIRTYATLHAFQRCISTAYAAYFTDVALRCILYRPPAVNPRPPRAARQRRRRGWEVRGRLTRHPRHRLPHPRLPRLGWVNLLPLPSSVTLRTGTKCPSPPLPPPTRDTVRPSPEPAYLASALHCCAQGSPAGRKIHRHSSRRDPPLRRACSPPNLSMRR